MVKEALTKYFAHLVKEKEESLPVLLARGVELPGLGMLFLRKRKADEPALVQFKCVTGATDYWADWLAEDTELDAASVGMELIEESENLCRRLKTMPYVSWDGFGTFEKVVNVSRVMSEESEDWSLERRATTVFFPSPILTAKVNEGFFPYEVDEENLRLPLAASEHHKGLPWSAIELHRHHLSITYGPAPLNRFLDTLSPGQRYLLIVQAFCEHIRDLGFTQFIYAESGLLLPLAWQSFVALEAPAYANICERVLSLFPQGEYALAAEVRRQALSHMDESAKLSLENLTRQMIYLQEDEPIERQVSTYLERKGEEFFYDLG